MASQRMPCLAAASARVEKARCRLGAERRVASDRALGDAAQWWWRRAFGDTSSARDLSAERRFGRAERTSAAGRLFGEPLSPRLRAIPRLACQVVTRVQLAERSYGRHRNEQRPSASDGSPLVAKLRHAQHLRPTDVVSAALRSSLEQITRLGPRSHRTEPWDVPTGRTRARHARAGAARRPTACENSCSSRNNDTRHEVTVGRSEPLTCRSARDRSTALGATRLWPACPRTRSHIGMGHDPEVPFSANAQPRAAPGRQRSRAGRSAPTVPESERDRLVTPSGDD